MCVDVRRAFVLFPPELGDFGNFENFENRKLPEIIEKTSKIEPPPPKIENFKIKTPKIGNWETSKSKNARSVFDFLKFSNFGSFDFEVFRFLEVFDFGVFDYLGSFRFSELSKFPSTGDRPVRCVLSQ